VLFFPGPAASPDEVVGREPVDSSVRVPASGIETSGRDSVVWRDAQWVGAKGVPLDRDRRLKCVSCGV
jgi:hypothetical protein